MAAGGGTEELFPVESQGPGENIAEINQRVHERMVSDGVSPADATEADYIRYRADVGHPVTPPAPIEGPVKLWPRSFTDPSARMGVVGTGTAAGIRAGSPLGPGGMLAGGMLGAAGGSLLHRGLENLETADLSQPPQFNLNTASEAAKEAAFEAMLVGGGELGAVAVGMGWRRLLAAMTGLDNPASKRVARTVLDKDLPMGVGQVGDSGFARSPQSILGVIPMLAGPWRKAAQKRSGALFESGGAQENMFRLYGPNLLMHKAGIRLVNRVNLGFSVFKDKSNGFYQGARDLAETHGINIVPSETRSVGAKITSDFKRGFPVEKVTRDASGNRVVRIKRKSAASVMPAVAGIARDAANLRRDGLDILEYESFVTKLGHLLDNAKPGSRESRFLTQIREAVEKDFANMDGPEEVLEAFGRADKFYAKGMRLFGSPTGKKLRTIDKRFGISVSMEPGTREADDAIRVVLGDQFGPQLVDSLYKMVKQSGRGGVSKWRSIVGTRLQEMFKLATKVDEATQVMTLESQSLKLQFGMNNKNGVRYQGWKRLVESAGGSMKKLEEFLDLSHRAFRDGIPDPTTFGRRRALLTGLAGASTFYAPGGTTSTLVGMVLVSKGLQLLVSSPKVMETALKAMRPSTGELARRRAARRLSIIAPTLFGAQAIADSTDLSEYQAAEIMNAPLVHEVMGRMDSFRSKPTTPVQPEMRSQPLPLIPR